MIFVSYQIGQGVGRKHHACFSRPMPRGPHDVQDICEDLGKMHPIEEGVAVILLNIVELPS